MLRRLISFELKLQIKRISVALFFALFFAVGYMGVVRGKGPLKLMGGLSAGITDTSAPYVLHFLVNFMSLAGTLIACSFFGRAGLRDFEDRMHGLYYSYPVRRSLYLAGRFAAALIAAALVFAGTGLGAWIGGIAPLAKITAGGTARPAAYLLPYLTGVLPTLLFTGTVFFALALLTRKIFSVYAGGTAIMILHIIGGALTQRTGTRLIGAMIDPFGEYAARSFYGVWSLAERNSRLIPFAGPYLLNRAVWLGAAVLIFAFLRRRLRFQEVKEPKERISKRRIAEKRDAGDGVDGESGWTQVSQSVRRFDLAARLRQTARTASFEFEGLVRNAAFIVILILTTVLQVLAGYRNIGLVRETTAYPLTSQVLASGFSFLPPVLLLIILFCSGELARRDRNSRAHILFDAAPAAEGVYVLGKAAALIGVIGLVLGLSMVNGMIIQTLQGWTRFQPELYLQDLAFIRLPHYACLGIFAFFLQILVRNRFLGYLLTVLLVDDFLESMGIEHHLWTFGSIPDPVYSDMNGYGPFAKSLPAYQFYWMFVSTLIIVLAILLYRRGEDLTWKNRIREFRRRWTRGAAAAAAMAAAGFLTTGAFIVYNTAFLNRFESTADMERQAADYEKSYKPYENIAQPQPTEVRVSVDLFPDEQRVASRGEMIYVNKTQATIPEIFLQTPRRARIKKLELDLPSDVTVISEPHAVRILRLRELLRPGAAIKIFFDLETADKGFKDRNENTRLVRNGTFLDHRDVLPSVGYDRFEEADNASSRKKYGLAPRKRLPPLDDPEAVMKSILGPDSGWIRYEAVLSTSGNQTAVTSGELVGTWETGGRRYFKYEAKGNILKYLPFLSAAYVLKKDRWRDVDIEIYHHPGHAFNVDRLISTAKESLDCFAEKFGPYPFRSLRILEFPRYVLSAEAFPGVIPVSEGYGFIARHKGSGVEELRRMIAHEISHQWWGMEVIGAGVEGEFLISETLAQHSALSVLRREYDERALAEFMKSRIDRYLRGRAREHAAEKPLARTNFETTYVHYDKGMVAMNALRDLMGEEALDAAVKSFLDKAAFRGSPYPTSKGLIEEIEKAAPENKRPAVAEMFEEIVLYDNRALGAEAEKLDQGKYRVTLRFETQKLRCDESGKETAAPIRDEIDFGVFDADGKALYRGKHAVRTAAGTLEFIVDRPPASAGIDPFFLLIDKNPNDNIIPVRTSLGKR